MAGRPLSMQGRLIFAKAEAFYSYMAAANQLIAAYTKELGKFSCWFIAWDQGAIHQNNRRRACHPRELPRL